MHLDLRLRRIMTFHDVAGPADPLQAAAAFYPVLLLYDALRCLQLGVACAKTHAVKCQAADCLENKGVQASSAIYCESVSLQTPTTGFPISRLGTLVPKSLQLTSLDCKHQHV